MNELDILRLHYASPLATLASFTEVQKAGAMRVLDAVTKERAEDDTKVADMYIAQRNEIRSLQEKLAAANAEIEELKKTLDGEIAALARCQKELAESDAHASAMEEATMRAHEACTLNVEPAVAQIVFEFKMECYQQRLTNILLKHFRAAPAVYVTDIEAAANDWYQDSNAHGRESLIERLRSYSKPINPYDLAEVIDKAWDDKDTFNVITAAYAVLSFLGAGAADSQASIVVGESRSGDASKMPQHEGASPDSSAARASLAEAARAKMNTPAPQESDELSLSNAMWAAIREWNKQGVQSPQVYSVDVCCKAALEWFRAHRVVELPPRANPHLDNALEREWCSGYDFATARFKLALTGAGIQFTEAK